MSETTKCCLLTFDGVFYCFNAVKRKVYVYTVKRLDHVDVISFRQPNLI